MYHSIVFSYIKGQNITVIHCCANDKTVSGSHNIHWWTNSKLAIGEMDTCTEGKPKVSFCVNYSFNAEDFRIQNLDRKEICISGQKVNKKWSYDTTLHFQFKRKMTWLLCVQRKLFQKNSIIIMPLNQQTRKKRVMLRWNQMRMILILNNNI
jgi:hypothetical protein